MTLVLDQARYRADHESLRARPHDIEADCHGALQQFPGHSLSEQVEVDLPDRTDSKYLLPIRVLPRFLEALSGDHSILTEAGHRVFTYQNTYFDTPGWDLYLQHHNGKRNRHKCRFRRYHETDISYLEIKLKSNKRRTIKERMPCTADEMGASVSVDLVVEPRLYVNYRRITLWNRGTGERLTLDFDLHFSRPLQGQLARLGGVFIAELKREGKVYGSTFVRRAKDYGYTPLPLSKYCVGVCLTDSGELKKNRFKPLLRKLGRLDTIGGLPG
jgi:hypothetical protein